ncbi:MAG: hypothetical protein LBK71_01730 [Verrucomicrobiales bacterium]|jgi:hypothetical protein|nr:hypothetical protein [Verrucomicrobiales bacterium]
MRKNISYLPAWLAMLFGAVVNATLFIDPLDETLWSLVVYVVMSLVTYWLLQKIFFWRHRNQAGADWSAAFILFTSTLTGLVSEGLLFKPGFDLPRGGIICYLIALALAFGILFYISTPALSKALKYFLIIGCVSTISVKIHGFCRSWRQITPLEDVVLTPTGPVTAKPDIYFVLMDEYSGNPALQQYWHYDNSSWHQQLARLDLQPVDNARSHINSTLYEMACLFNLTGFRQLDYAFRYGNFGLFFHRYVRTNKLFTFLREQGYTLELDSLLAADDPLFFSPVHTNKFNHHLSSILGRCLQTKLLYTMIYNRKLADQTRAALTVYDRVRLSDLVRTLEKKIDLAPSFTYLHLMFTHTPYRYASDGSTSPDATYLSQIAYNNTLTLDFARQLIGKYQQANKPLVLILMSDHGSRGNAAPDEDQSIQMLVYDSSDKLNHLEENLDGVNLFRMLLAAHFNVPLPKQEYPGFTYIANPVRQPAASPAD